ncbi:MAG: TFIIB-type zinc finger domain-containing protein [Eubacteriales bacterium]|nr:TFIIB-type zinc finger domain-containing protein [Eubacteriales bacterium]
MKAIKCEMCGSPDVIKEDGLYVCHSCGTKYSVEEAKKLMIEGPVEVYGTVKVDSGDRLQNLYTLARRARGTGDSANAEKYYNEIAIEDPNSWEAQFYKVYCGCMNITLAQMKNACIRLANCLGNVFSMIQKNVSDPVKQKAAFIEIDIRYREFYIFILSNINSHVESVYSSTPEYAMKFNNYNGKALVTLNVVMGDNLANVGLDDHALHAYKSGQSFWENLDSTTVDSIVAKIKKIEPEFEYSRPQAAGCYVATAVYGSYDCPEVWTLRRYRDYELAETWYGRGFIRIYYAMSPVIVRWFGQTVWFKKMWKGALDNMVNRLKERGFESTPYDDKEW